MPQLTAANHLYYTQRIHRRVASQPSATVERGHASIDREGPSRVKSANRHLIQPLPSSHLVWPVVGCELASPGWYCSEDDGDTTLGDIWGI